MDKITKNFKLQTVGSSTGIIIKKDDLNAMGLRKGNIVKITVEKIKQE